MCIVKEEIFVVQKYCFLLLGYEFIDVRTFTNFNISFYANKYTVACVHTLTASTTYIHLKS